MAEELKKDTVEGQTVTAENENSGATETLTSESEGSVEGAAAEESTKEETASEETSEESKAEESADSEEEAAQEEPPATAAATQPVANDKVELAQMKIEAAQARARECEAKVEKRLREIEEDLKRFKQLEEGELHPVVAKSKELLEEMGVEEVPEVRELVPAVDMPNPEADRLHIPQISSGKGGAFFLALLGGIATVAGWYAFVALKAGLPLIPKSVPDMATCTKVASTLSEIFGQGPNPSVGAAIIVVSALIVMWLIYAVLVSIRGAKNLRQAEEVEDAVSHYCRQKEEGIDQIEAVHEHLENLEQTVHKYEVILAELNAGLRRAQHIEEANSFDELHDKTKEAVKQLEELLRELDTLLTTPATVDGAVNAQSIEALRQAKRAINEQILRIYS